MLTLAHISDLHIDGTARANARVQHVMDYIDSAAASVDALVVTGDLTENGTRGELEEVRALLAGRLPVITCPGNHDTATGRAPYRQVMLGDAPSETPVNTVHRLSGGAVVLCDSAIPGSPGGRLAEETLQWLEQTLAELAPAPVVLGLHHHPVRLHTPYVDHIGLQEPDRLAALLERHPHVVGLLCGHAHTPAFTTFAQRPLAVAPGTVSVAPLPWEDAGTVRAAHPPALAFHILDDGRMTTHIRTVPTAAD